MRLQKQEQKPCGQDDSAKAAEHGLVSEGFYQEASQYRSDGISQALADLYGGDRHAGLRLIQHFNGVGLYGWCTRSLTEGFADRGDQHYPQRGGNSHKGILRQKYR